MIFGAFERMVAFRYLRARRQEGFISVIAIFSLLGIALGVATLIIVMAVMNGFRQELLTKILGLNGHLLIQPLESPLTDYVAVADRVGKVDGVYLAFAQDSGPRGSSERQKVQYEKAETNAVLEDTEFRFPAPAAPGAPAK